MAKTRIDTLLYEVAVRANVGRFKQITKSFAKLDVMAKELGVSQAKLTGAFQRLGIQIKKTASGGAALWDKATGKLIGYHRAAELAKESMKQLDAPNKKAAGGFDELTDFQGQIVPEAAKRFGSSQSAVRRELKKNNMVIKRVNTTAGNYQRIINKDTGATMKFDQAMGRLGKSMRGFHMENLSLLFFGMQLQRIFGGMIKRVTDLIGVNELWGAVLQTILMPILIPLVDLFAEMLDFFNEHPKVAKMTGYFIIFAAVLGTVAFWGAQISLLMGSLVKLFPILRPVIVSLGAGFGYFIGILMGLIFIVYQLYKAFKNNFFGIRDEWEKLVEDFKELTQDLLDFFKETWEMIKAIFRGDWDAVWDHAKKAWESFKKYFKKSWKAFGRLLKIIIIGALSVFWDWFARKANNFIDWINRLSKGFLGGDIIKGKIPKLSEMKPSPEEEGTLQFGGRINRDGLYRLHKGESVISPTGIGDTINNNPNITINVNGSGNPRETARQVMEIIKPEFERLSGSRRI